mmetsp:Transcript_19464/g.56753  ORF Transcript_19464/g.56753 Transcript_19464/m.56753 type:complete len:200 (-) Transcript_19464:916-1515(-)
MLFSLVLLGRLAGALCHILGWSSRAESSHETSAGVRRRGSLRVVGALGRVGGPERCHESSSGVRGRCGSLTCNLVLPRGLERTQEVCPGVSRGGVGARIRRRCQLQLAILAGGWLLGCGCLVLSVIPDVLQLPLCGLDATTQGLGLAAQLGHWEPRGALQILQFLPEIHNVGLLLRQERIHNVVQDRHALANGPGLRQL